MIVWVGVEYCVCDCNMHGVVLVLTREEMAVESRGRKKQLGTETSTFSAGPLIFPASTFLGRLTTRSSHL